MIFKAALSAAVDLTSLKLGGCQRHIIFTGTTHQRAKGKEKRLMGLKKNIQKCFLSLSPFTIQLENVTGTMETARFFNVFFLPDTFSTDNSFHGRLTSDLALPFSLFDLGGGLLRGSDWMFF